MTKPAKPVLSQSPLGLFLAQVKCLLDQFVVGGGRFTICVPPDVFEQARDTFASGSDSDRLLAVLGRYELVIVADTGDRDERKD